MTSEVFVKGRKNKWLPLIFIIIGALYIIISFFLMTFLAFVGIAISSVLLVLLICLIVFLNNYYKIEYEYSVFSGDFEINEIRNQVKRKQLIKCRIKDIRDFKKIFKKDMVYQKSENGRQYFCFGENDEIIYCFSVRGEEGMSEIVYIADVPAILEKLAVQNFEVRKTIST